MINKYSELCSMNTVGCAFQFCSKSVRDGACFALPLGPPGVFSIVLALFPNGALEIFSIVHAACPEQCLLVILKSACWMFPFVMNEQHPKYTDLI
jgi:hypothetical protein